FSQLVRCFFLSFFMLLVLRPTCSTLFPYTTLFRSVVNDISDRKYHPNSGRKERPRDAFFDWMHGKWHDGFFPVGPAIASAKAIRSEEHTSELQSRENLVCRLLLEKKNKIQKQAYSG